jgi:Sulfotransferase domain
MLVICNGAIKSGSTWLYNILASLRDFSVPHEKYLTLKNPRHPCIRPDRLKEFLETEDYVQKDYLSKNHLDKPGHKAMVQGKEHVYVFDIERDPRDVAVSHYYHEQFRNAYSGTFEQFYWTIGRRTVASLSRYHSLWKNGDPRFYVSSYERLHCDFHVELCNIAAVLGVSLSAHDVEAVRQKTSLGSLRKEYEKEPRFEGSKFFRKGEIGDWKNHFDAEMLRDVERIETRGLGWLDLPRIRYRLDLMRSRR